MGLLDDEGLGAAFGNEMLRRRATNERARMLARQQEPSLPPDINSSQFPRVNAAIQGLLGTAPNRTDIERARKIFSEQGWEGLRRAAAAGTVPAAFMNVDWSSMNPD